MGLKRRTTDVIKQDEPSFGTPYVLALAVIHGPDRHAIHRITATETKVGRSEEADFVIADNLVSDLHFEVRINGNLYSLVDLGSTNGTQLNQNLVTEGVRVRLKNFDEIQAGRTRFLFIANRFRVEE
jgi:pSer/pThr/pTyr-binding forkhead associated (FHA) protein